VAGPGVPGVWFERYADDAVLHCVSEQQARQVLTALGDRMAEVGLELHPGKSRIVYCQDGRRRGSFEHTAFTFLGFTFRQRRVMNKQGRVSSGFVPAISGEAMKRISSVIRSWRLNRKVDFTVDGLARWINPIVAGWIQYYGRFYRSALGPLARRINAYLVRWLRRKYRRLRTLNKALRALAGAAKRCPRLFAHWRITIHADPVW
jgi:RNA-directed DNA polymerase